MKLATLLIPFVLAACGSDHLAPKTQALETVPIEALPPYKGGQILHPWHFAKPNAQRFPQRSVGLGSDPQCFLADSYFRSCLIYECAADYSCATGTCVDAAMAFDADNSVPGEDANGGTYWESGGWRYYPLHMAVCVR